MEKLVRDKIPGIIREDGEEPIIERVSEEEREKLLREKAVEEAEEFAEDGEMEELADMLQVITSYLRLQGEKMEDLEDLRKEKEAERGGFEERIILKEVR